MKERNYRKQYLQLTSFDLKEVKYPANHPFVRHHHLPECFEFAHKKIKHKVKATKNGTNPCSLDIIHVSILFQIYTDAFSEFCPHLLSAYCLKISLSKESLPWHTFPPACCNNVKYDGFLSYQQNNPWMWRYLYSLANASFCSSCETLYRSLDGKMV